MKYCIYEVLVGVANHVKKPRTYAVIELDSFELYNLEF